MEEVSKMKTGLLIVIVLLILLIANIYIKTHENDSEPEVFVFLRSLTNEPSPEKLDINATIINVGNRHLKLAPHYWTAVNITYRGFRTGGSSDGSRMNIDKVQFLAPDQSISFNITLLFNEQTTITTHYFMNYTFFHTGPKARPSRGIPLKSHLLTFSINRSLNQTIIHQWD